MDEPICRHDRKGIVRAGRYVQSSFASTSVCDRPECIAQAIEWANRYTQSTDAEYIADGAR